MSASTQLAGTGGDVLERQPVRATQQASTATAIRAVDLTKEYRNGVRALGGVSFEVGWGRIFAYLGRNGSGKTTTVRVLTTLARPTSGVAFVAGHDVLTQAAAVRRTIGVTMQEAALDDLMSGMEHLELVGRLWGHSATDARRRAEELLEAFGLIDAGKRLIATYSGGMRRRLDIATSLLNHPRVLFLDEPTTGLDPQSRRAMWSIIRKARDEGTAVFLTTQYLEEADQLADTVAIVSAGQIVASGTVGDLKSNFGRATIRLSLPEADRAELRAITGTANVDIEGDDSVRIELLGAASEGSAVLHLLAQMRERRLRIGGLSVREASLEDVFVRLTGERMDQSAAGSSGGSKMAAVLRASGLSSGGA